MNSPFSSRPPVGALEPAFTLGSALRWLAHDCPGHACSEVIEDLTASVWFVLRDGRFRTYPWETLVLLDPDETGVSGDTQQVIDQVNWCTRGDAIRVRSRRVALRGRANAE